MEVKDSATGISGTMPGDVRINLIYGVPVPDPLDPFEPQDDSPPEPIDDEERAALLDDLADLAELRAALEQRGFVRGTWGVTENNRKARFYALTPAGKKQLAAEKREWSRMVTTMQAILNEPS